MSSAINIGDFILNAIHDNPKKIIDVFLEEDYPSKNHLQLSNNDTYMKRAIKMLYENKPNNARIHNADIRHVNTCFVLRLYNRGKKFRDNLRRILDIHTGEMYQVSPEIY